MKSIIRRREKAQRNTQGETRAIMVMMMMVQRVKWLLECIRMHAATHLMISPFNRHTQTDSAAFSDIPHVWVPLLLCICLLQRILQLCLLERSREKERMQIAFRFSSSRIDCIDGYRAQETGRAGKVKSKYRFALERPPVRLIY